MESESSLLCIFVDCILCCLVACNKFTCLELFYSVVSPVDEVLCFLTLPM